MNKNKEIGRKGEKLANIKLINDGYKIIAKNYYCKFGEIDIIAEKRNELVFVEVKTRTQKKYGMPVDAVNNVKLKHMYRVAEYFLMEKKQERHAVRFDVIEIYINENEKNKINHIKNIIIERPFS